jgi:hypothetical protein
MRRAFKVATAFTGAAACVAVLTPGVTAAAATTSKSRQMKPADLINCPAGWNTSVHLYWPSTAHHGPTCVGNHQFKAWPAISKAPSGPRYHKLCSGNNNGSYRSSGSRYYYGYKNGRFGMFSLGGGKAWWISNKSWNGHASCPFTS